MRKAGCESRPLPGPHPSQLQHSLLRRRRAASNLSGGWASRRGGRADNGDGVDHMLSIEAVADRASIENGTEGWLADALRAPSPNCDRRPADTCVDLLVIHGISLPPGEFGGPWIDDLFRNRLDPGAHPYFPGIARLRVSAHLLIRRDGGAHPICAPGTSCLARGAVLFSRPGAMQ